MGLAAKRVVFTVEIEFDREITDEDTIASQLTGLLWMTCKTSPHPKPRSREGNPEIWSAHGPVRVGQFHPIPADMEED